MEFSRELTIRRYVIDVAVIATFFVIMMLWNGAAAAMGLNQPNWASIMIWTAITSLVTAVFVHAVNWLIDYDRVNTVVDSDTAEDSDVTSLNSRRHG